MEGEQAIESVCVFSLVAENLPFAEEAELEVNGSSFPPPPPMEVPLELTPSEAEIFRGVG